MKTRPAIWILNNAPLLLFVLVLALFASQSGKFIELQNLKNILIQTASTGILAVGMTFVLLTAGVDLSVGAVMFLCAAIGGKMIFQGAPFSVGLMVMLLIGLAYGAFNAFFVTRLKIMAFIVTLATMYVGRGLGLWITETRAMNLPEQFYQLGATHVLGIPLPVWIFGLVVLLAHVVLTATPLGRQVYAVGRDTEAARKAGLPVQWILFSVYVICSLCAALAAIVALSQAPAVSPSFGKDREFAAIAAAVLGGTSLFGGKGKVFPGTVLGAVLIQTVENGLNILNVNPYLYPMITAGIIFIAVLLDAMRNGLLSRLLQRKIRTLPGD